jgi:hypothetical protein
MRTSILRAFAVSLAVAAPLGMALAAPGKTAVASHPNLLAAQKLCAQAFTKLEAAQKANEYDLGGHAQKAKDALKLANDEIKLAADAADKK